MKGPHRTCLGCRRLRPKAALLRLVRDARGIVRPDASGSEPGRGAYVCADSDCIPRALKLGRLRQAFRQPCEPATALRDRGRGDA